MLPWVCSVIDHRRRQNVVRTSVTHSAIASCATFLFLPHFDVICDLLLNRRTATWNLFVKCLTFKGSITHDQLALINSNVTNIGSSENHLYTENTVKCVAWMFKSCLPATMLVKNCWDNSRFPLPPLQC